MEWPAAYGCVILQQVTSTLDEARRLSADKPAPFWVLAHHQSKARGRRGRPWSMPKGSFAGTLVLRPQGSASAAAQRSFVMSLALYRAFVGLTRCETAFSLKWPNDVLLNDGKVAGILLEGGGTSGVLTIGVGANLIAAPPASEVEAGAVRPVSVLEETGVEITPEDLLLAVAHHYSILETQFLIYGFAPIRTAWLAHAARLGDVITARIGDRESVGTFEDVDAEGQLVLRGAHGPERIAAADVYF